ISGSLHWCWSDSWTASHFSSSHRLLGEEKEKSELSDREKEYTVISGSLHWCWSDSWTASHFSSSHRLLGEEKEKSELSDREKEYRV
ncbi:Uncharacterized protein DAT39_015778, partial [Clarias magur]